MQSPVDDLPNKKQLEAVHVECMSFPSGMYFYRFEMMLEQNASSVAVGSWSQT